MSGVDKTFERHQMRGKVAERYKHFQWFGLSRKNRCWRAKKSTLAGCLRAVSVKMGIPLRLMSV
jgi:hypothetical protein